ncbi:MAG: glycoside hydrolase family 2 TIM barrel-domain containing protein [Bacteroidaceae bacterium]|nr:glycoside hydrolase family 2 TIM barrel-domain containing protein [Bacteroidaceae bacterium]
MLLCLTLGTAFCTANAVDIPRPEYPRPQFERTDWVNLNGQWTFEMDFGSSGEQRGWTNSKGLSKKITVPFCPESELSGIGYTDFIPCVWYQRNINIPAEWNGKKILLHFGAADYETKVYVDGKMVGEHKGAGSSFNFDITSYVKAGQQANLVVRVYDNLRGGMQPGGKQCTALYSAGCSYTRVTGIWQTVWMEAVNEQALKNVFAIPDIDQQQLVVRPEFYNEGNNNTLTVEVKDGKKTVAKRTSQASNQSTIVLPIKNAHLWSPEDPYLYDVKYTVKNAQGEVIDEVSSYMGMRKVHISGGYFYLNNKPYFQRLVLDQGYYPDGIWTAPSDEALRQDIEMSKAVGFNGARLHQKVFEERYYYWADKLGYLTWGEEASWVLNINNELAVRNFLTEWAEIVVRDRNHPSLVTWTPLNETWNATPGVYVRFVNDLYALTKAIDPTRPINDASGDSHVKTDIWSVHDYTREPDKLIANHTIKAGVEPYRNMKGKDFLSNYAGQPYMVDEFGGLPWIPKEERANSWGYGANIDTVEEFYSILEKEIDALKACKHVVGFCYTQITDVEQEKNGIYYYNRKPKFDTARVKAIFEKIPSIIENPQDLSDWK